MATGGDAKRDMILLAGNSHSELATHIADRLGIRLAACAMNYNTARETMIEIEQSVRGKDIYIIQTGTKNVNNDVMEMLILAYALKTASARSITGVIPYLPYQKQSKMRFRSCIVSKLTAKMMVKAGFTHILTVDLRSKEVQGFFDVPVDNLRASAFLIQYVQQQIPDYKDAVIVAKDAHATRKAVSFAERLRLPLAVIHGRQKEADSDSEDLERAPSPPPSSVLSRSFELTFVPQQVAKEKMPMSVVGDVAGHSCLIIDDMVGEMQPYAQVADVLKENGAKKVYVIATHGVFSPDAPLVINRSRIDEVIVSNSVPNKEQKQVCSKIKTVDISLLLCEAIRRVHFGESMSYLYRGVTDND